MEFNHVNGLVRLSSRLLTCLLTVLACLMVISHINWALVAYSYGLMECKRLTRLWGGKHKLALGWNVAKRPRYNR